MGEMVGWNGTIYKYYIKMVHSEGYMNLFLAHMERNQIHVYIKKYQRGGNLRIFWAR